MFVEGKTLFISHAPQDQPFLEELLVHLAPLLRATGLQVFPGYNWTRDLGKTLEAASVILVLVSPHYLASKNHRVELALILKLWRAGARVVPILLRPCVWENTELRRLQMLPRDGRSISTWTDPYEAWTDVVQSLRNIIVHQQQPGGNGEPKAAPRPLLLHRVRLRDVRCFESLDVDLSSDGGPAPLLLLVGENSTGKSTLLRSIALGLAGTSHAAALLKQMPGALIRQQAERGEIDLELLEAGTGKTISINTVLLRDSSGEEIIAAKEASRDSFPWQELFVCAYGTGRSHQATSSYDRYSLHQALLPLFDDSASLQNPELILLRQDPYVRAQLEKRLLQVLMLEDPEYTFTYSSGGAQLHTPWGDQAPNTLSDGYRSTTQWLLDFLSWAIYAGRLRNGDPIGGMLIIDEIEQHLHPRWQRHILQRLHQQFPGTQIFTSTHTPLVAAAAADVEGALLVRLEADAHGKVSAQRIEREEIVGLRADQMLAEVFGLYTSRSPGSQDDISRYAELLGKAKRTAEEEAQLETLRKSLEENLQLGENAVQQKVGAAVDQALEGMVEEYQPELVDLEKRRLLKELFDKV